MGESYEFRCKKVLFLQKLIKCYENKDIKSANASRVKFGNQSTLSSVGFKVGSNRNLNESRMSSSMNSSQIKFNVIKFP